MIKIDAKQFFMQYPHYSNFDELKKADILIMPSRNNAFLGSQLIFQNVSNDYGVNCLFYSEDQNSLPCILQESFVPIDIIHELGFVISTVASLHYIYTILKDKMQNKRFKIENVISMNNDDYLMMDKFEGNIDEYKAAIQEINSQIEMLLSKRN